MERQTTTVRFSKEEYQIIRREAYERNISINKLMKQAIATYIGLYSKPDITKEK